MKSLRSARSPSRGERGQSLVELAISLTVMLLLLAGAVTFGMALFSYVALRDAAQEGALWGSFTPCIDPTGASCDSAADLNSGPIRDRVRAASDSPVRLSDFPDEDIKVDLIGDKPCEGSTGTGANAVPNAIKVTLEYDYPIIMPYVGGIIGSQKIHLTASVTDTILSPVCQP